MIHALSAFKRLFSCFNPAIDVLTSLFKKIFCCPEALQTKPLKPDRVKAIKPSASDTNLILKNLVSDRVKDNDKRNSKVVPSASDANIFCGVTQPSERTFNLESEKRKKVIEHIQKAKSRPEEDRKLFDALLESEREKQVERIKNSRSRNKILGDLRKSREGLTEEEWKAQYQAEDQIRQQRNKEIIKAHANVKLKIEKGLNEARNLDPTMPEVVYNLNGFIYLRQKSERKEASKESIEAGYKRFKAHCKNHQEKPAPADIAPEEKNQKIKDAHVPVLKYIHDRRTSGSANFAQVMKGILVQPKLKVLTQNQVQTLEVKKKFLEDLQNTLARKKPSDPSITLRYFATEFAQANLPITPEKLREWRMALNSLMDPKFDLLKEAILKLITLQTTYNELPQYSINTRSPIQLQSQQLLEELKARVQAAGLSNLT